MENPIVAEAVTIVILLADVGPKVQGLYLTGKDGAGRTKSSHRLVMVWYMVVFNELTQPVKFSSNILHKRSKLKAPLLMNQQ